MFQILLILLILVKSEGIVLLKTVMKALRTLYERELFNRRLNLPLDLNTSSEIDSYIDYDTRVRIDKYKQEDRVRLLIRHGRQTKFPLWKLPTFVYKPFDLREYLPRFSKGKKVGQKLFTRPIEPRRVKRMVKMKENKLPLKIRNVIRKRKRRQRKQRIYARIKITYPPQYQNISYEYQNPLDTFNLGLEDLLALKPKNRFNMTRTNATRRFPAMLSDVDHPSSPLKLKDVIHLMRAMDPKNH